MKRLLLECVLFFLFFMAGAYFLDGWFSNNLRKTRSGDLGVWNEIYSGNVDADIVIYGASRAWVQFDPRIISDALGMTTYNLGIDGHGFPLQYLRHSLFLKYNAKPKVIIQSVDIFTLEKRKDLYGAAQFLPFMLTDPRVEAATSSYEGFTYLDYHVPMLRYYGRTGDLASAVRLFLHPPGYPPDRIRGYMGQDSVWNGDWERAQREVGAIEIVPDPATVRLFEAYLQECRLLGIRVIFVDPPEYFEARHFVTNRAEILGIFKKLGGKFGIPYLDYTDDPICYQIKYFYNSEHMNRAGAELFTKKFVADLKPLMPHAIP